MLVAPAQGECASSASTACLVAGGEMTVRLRLRLSGAHRAGVSWSRTIVDTFARPLRGPRFESRRGFGLKTVGGCGFHRRGNPGRRAGGTTQPRTKKSACSTVWSGFRGVLPTETLSTWLSTPDSWRLPGQSQPVSEPSLPGPTWPGRMVSCRVG